MNLSRLRLVEYVSMADSRETAMNTIESINLIYRNPEVRGGRPCIVGTGLRVMDLVMAMRFHNRSPEQMAADYQVRLAEVHAALAYYFDNQEEIDADIHEDIRRSDELVKEGWGKPDDSIFPINLSTDEMDELLDELDRFKGSAENQVPGSSAAKRQIVRDFLAKIESQQLEKDIG